MKTFIPIVFASIVLMVVFSGCSDMILAPENQVKTETISRAVTYSSTDDDFPGCYYEIGILGPGAAYQIVYPIGWDGDLILYSHGYEAPGEELVVSYGTDLPYEIILELLSMGYAVAYSNYSENGWAVKDGVIRTRQLRDYFINKFGVPDRVYLVGVSEGALIAVKLAEQNPDLLDGVLAIAGPLGGAEAQFEYILNTRLTFDYFFKQFLYPDPENLSYPPYPPELPVFPYLYRAELLASALGYEEDLGALEIRPPSDPYSMTEFIDLFYPAITKLMSYKMTETMAMAAVTVDNEYLFPYENWTGNSSWIYEFAYTVATALWYNIHGTEDILIKTHGQIPLDNINTTYRLGIDGVVLQVEERYESHPSAVKYLEHWYKPEGNLSIPVVVVHTKRDPAVPYFHAEMYKLAAPSILLISPPLDSFPLPPPFPDIPPVPDIQFGHGYLMSFSPFGEPSVSVEDSMNLFRQGFFRLRFQVEDL